MDRNSSVGARQRASIQFSLEETAMKVFVLEDSEERIQRFSEIFGEALTVARTVGEGKTLFQPPYDLILLDHDLGELETGKDFSNWLVESKQTPTNTIIHSWNVGGALSILRTLAEAGWRNVTTMTFDKRLLDTLRWARRNYPQR
jgi:hypothetical protein